MSYNAINGVEIFYDRNKNIKVNTLVQCVWAKSYFVSFIYRPGAITKEEKEKILEVKENFDKHEKYLTHAW